MAQLGDGVWLSWGTDCGSVGGMECGSVVGGLRLSRGWTVSQLWVEAEWDSIKCSASCWLNDGWCSYESITHGWGGGVDKRSMKRANNVALFPSFVSQ